jgi:hypothetical protein
LQTYNFYQIAEHLSLSDTFQSSKYTQSFHKSDDKCIIVTNNNQSREFGNIERILDTLVGLFSKWDITDKYSFICDKYHHNSKAYCININHMKEFRDKKCKFNIDFHHFY